MRIRYYLAVLVLTTTSLGINAVEFECSLNNETRSIRLEYPGQEHLCEVSVTTADNERDVKWYADNDSSFCSEKLYELVDKYIQEWEYSCKSWPNQASLDSLSARHRSILDNTVKRVTQEGTSAEIPFVVANAHALTTYLQEENKTAIVVQLFLETNEATIKSDRTYFYIDDGEEFSTTAVFAGLKQNIKLLDDSYQVKSAEISAVHSTGEIEVNTTLGVTNTDNTESPTCFGSQFFKPNAEGTLDPVNQHRYVCNM